MSLSLPNLYKPFPNHDFTIQKSQHCYYTFRESRSPFILPDVMLIDSFDITHHAYPLMEEALIQGDERNWSLVSDSSENTAAYCKRELKSAKGQVYTTYSDEYDTPLVKLIPKRLILLTKSTKKSRGEKSKFVPPLNPVEIIDDNIEPKKDRKEREMCLWVVQRSRGLVITGFGVGELLILLQAQGWNALFLQGNRRRNMGRIETREFYINAVGSASSVSSKVGGMSFTLTAEKLSRILCVPNIGWCHYVKRNWPPLEGLLSALEISRRFVNDPMLEDYTRVDKGAMLSLHHAAIPATSTRENAPMQHLRASLTAKGEEIAALKVSHSASMDKLHISFGLEHAGLVEKNYRLKEELAKTQAVLDIERSSNSSHLKHIVYLLAKGSPSSSSFMPPSV
ncbi:hypothetical protein KY290_007877 [Solanum tuberosum]|uniref:Uncharacterized protein n=1 Tax=Solanum tuberosum TaxID=4113 RepID=A0ABQ7W6T8_SOLTU|nr:hypothetical protein KY290_007877 [Solanum tuberosum]